MEPEKTVVDYLGKVSPGTPLRTVIDDLLNAGDIGGLIVFDSFELQNITTRGFTVDCKFSPQKLFELSKMDGAVIVSPDLKKIIAANVLLTPDPEIASNETGTRHQAAERTAKQANTFVISISARRGKSTLYFANTRYILKNAQELIRKTSSNIQILEKQRETFTKIINNLNLLELSDLVSINDVCQTIQRAEIILKISESIRRNFIELGQESDIMRIRYKELLKGIAEIEEKIILDYSNIPLEETKELLSTLNFENLFDIDQIAELIFKDRITTSPKGHRFLSNTTLTEEETQQLINNFNNLKNILEAQPESFLPILGEKTLKIQEEINTLREQILTGKEVF